MAHVLLVEDEPLIRAGAAAGLRDAGFEVTDAGSGEDALGIAEAFAHPPHVLVTDLQLGPGMTGLDLATEALRRWPDLGVVYATGNPQDFDGRMLGPRERYVVKPYTAAGLLQAIRRVLA